MKTLHQRLYVDAKKHMKKCSTSLNIREIQNKTAKRHHYTSIKINKISMLTTPSVGENVGETGTAGVNVK